MENLPKDILYSIEMELNCSDVLGLTNKIIYDKICNNIHFMRNKLFRDFGFIYNRKDTKRPIFITTFYVKIKTNH